MVGVGFPKDCHFRWCLDIALVVLIDLHEDSPCWRYDLKCRRLFAISGRRELRRIF